MRKLMAIVFLSACIVCMFGCKMPNEAEVTDFSITEGVLDGGADIGIDAIP